MLEPPALPAPSWTPRILAAGAILAATIALTAMLGQSVNLGGASPATSAGRAGSARDRARAQPARARVRDRRANRALRRTATSASPADTLPFPPNQADRATRPGEVPSLYADDLECSTGCRPYGAEIGWPLAPFHVQHPIRAGLNELRPASLHVGVDIQARDGAAVYAVQPGLAQVLAPSGANARVQVGNYISELGDGGQYVDPLRPGGTVLEPYVDRAPPVIGAPAVAIGGQVIVPAYDPQTYVRRTTYVTPVLAPAAIAYRLYDAQGTAVTTLEWAFRGSQLLPYSERSLIYAPGSHAPGFACFATRPVCVPRWIYRVAGGLAPPLPPPGTLAPGRYRLTIYAWDWADNTTALDTNLTLTASGWRPVGRFPAALLDAPGYFTRSELLPPVSTLGGQRAVAPPAPAAASGRSPATPAKPRPATVGTPSGSPAGHRSPVSPSRPNGSAALLPSTPHRH